ncbi:SUMF1/EgtB/PvdO family nonheme iron enzyme [Gemmata sp.]|uniref:SUMF1/EgtB/PvdO family nonheme iron enzyme n=1 Tax=Gemmata sp. TaxID=1914242 RepID=UPI003F72DBF5
MSVMGPLAALTLKSAFGSSVDQLIGWLGARFSNPAQPLQRALVRAGDNAWKTLGFALAGDELFARVQPWFPGRDLTPLRETVRAFLANAATGLHAATPGLRLQAAVELARVRRAGRLAVLIDRTQVLDDLWRCGDTTRLILAAEDAVARVADALAADAPRLAQAVRLAPKDGLPPLAAALLYYFRREAEYNQDLARGLSFDSVRLATAGTERGIVFLDGPPPSVLDHFDMLFDPLVDWHSRAVAELATFRREVRDWRGTHGVAPAAADAPVEVLAVQERERVLQFHGRLRQVPGELVEWADWQGLGDNLAACGLFKEARAAHTAAAAQARVDAEAGAEAENYFRIYKDACESSKWPEAREALLRAAKLDPARFRPFDTCRYQIDAVLGVSAFGTLFRCLDTEELDDAGNPTPVAVRALRTPALDRDVREVLADARRLRDLHRPGSRIVRSLSWGFARTDPDAPARKERPYLVTEFFPGETLDAVVRRHGPVPVPVLLPVALQVAEAVRKAHSKGVCHRDLTPANVLSRVVDGNWDVRVIDFGLSAPHEAVTHASLNLAAKRSTARDKSLTRSLEFAAPEQRGRLPGVAVGPHSDVYAFGKTCAWLLFQTTLPQPHHWAAVPEAVRQPLQALLERATADAPEARFRSFDEVIAALKAFFQPPAPPPVPEPVAEAVPEAVAEAVPEVAPPPPPPVATARSAAVSVPAPRPVAPGTPRSAPVPVPAPRPVAPATPPWPVPAVPLPVEALHEEIVEELEPVELDAADEPPTDPFQTKALEPVEEPPQPVEEPVQELDPVSSIERAAVPPPDPAADEPVHELEPAEPRFVLNPADTQEMAVPPDLKAQFPPADEPAPAPDAPARAPAPEPKKPRAEGKKDPLAPGRIRTAGERFTIKLPGNLPLTFAWCPPGAFQMGSTRADANTDEKPAHTVALTKGFFIGIYPVTQAQWKAALMPTEPSNFAGPDRPVEQVLWEESQKFCRQITRNLKGRGAVRLPTEAEWEYACRAGTDTEFHTGDGEAALARAGWYETNSGKETHPVGRLAPNAWGISDTHGNVWEWCGDWYAEYTADPRTDPTGPATGTDRVFRGGGWGDSAKFCRSTYRSWFDPAVRYDALGFRVVLVPSG